MASELLDVEPRELKFIFEMKKQSSCSVRLTNKTDQYVAFKVKTTSPKRYCVRPNAGVILPKTSLDFTVTLLSMRVAPSDMQCKDKFLVQSTVVQFGITEDDMKPEYFSKESGRYIEEKKLKVLLISPPHSPVLQPLNGSLKEELATKHLDLKEVQVLKENDLIKEGTSHKEVPPSNSPKEVPVTIFSQETLVLKELDCFKETSISNGLESSEAGVQSIRVSKDVEQVEVMKDMELEELKTNLSILNSRLNEIEKMNAALEEEKSLSLLKRQKLKQEIALMKHQNVARVRAGFPLLFVCFIGLVGVVLGYKLHGA